jgi:AraC-like DNA-binding protein
VAARPDQPPSIPDMATASGLSPGHFAAQFKQVFHITPRQYVNRLRIERARQRLLTTSLSIDQIAQSLGFAYTHYFDRLFKRETRQTPGAYREMHRL